MVVSQYGGVASAAACSYVCTPVKRLPIQNYGAVQLTGGCSSTFSPLSGFAFRFAKTPSFEEV